MEFIVEDGKQIHEDCSRLVLPALSIGNVGQLAVDLLITTLRAERIGFLDDPFVLPCIGNDAYWPTHQGELALPLEAYDSSPNGLSLIQQRSPVVKGMMIEFAKNMADFAVASGKKHVIILSSLDFGRWQKIDMSSGLQTYYLSSSNPDGTDSLCERLGWKKLPEYQPDQRCWKYLRSVAEGDSAAVDSMPAEDDFTEEDYYPSLPFSALFSFFKAKGLDVTCLLCYCSEGDNISDATHLAEATCKLLEIGSDSQGECADWVIPLSWKTLYGPPPDISMF
ncbi:hypothetical protein SAY86_025483 [Trapa natans]|uniref:Proteasome assembly chaperone 2 n=1 Tax=Trapa natans TaxID=22666 RepID=A0AAN7RKT0_TRANT|nr:hypothetical protein SAY86_025483 [Trapa natans]